MGAAGAQSVLEYSELWSEPDEFYLSEAVSDETFTFDETRRVRVCVNDPEGIGLATSAALGEPADVALEVERDSGRMITVEPGDCSEFQARHVEVSPAGSIESGWTLYGTIESQEPQSNS